MEKDNFNEVNVNRIISGGVFRATYTPDAGEVIDLFNGSLSKFLLTTDGAMNIAPGASFTQNFTCDRLDDENRAMMVMLVGGGDNGTVAIVEVEDDASDDGTFEVAFANTTGANWNIGAGSQLFIVAL